MLAELFGLKPERELSEAVHPRIGPAARLIIAGMSSISVACAEFARTLGFEVILCDPRENAFEGVELPGIEVKPVLPSMFISARGCTERQNEKTRHKAGFSDISETFKPSLKLYLAPRPGLEPGTQ